jgi:hypothetical protein
MVDVHQTNNANDALVNILGSGNTADITQAGF